MYIPCVYAAGLRGLCDMCALAQNVCMYRQGQALVCMYVCLLVCLYICMFVSVCTYIN